jgi:rhodanese-related sulfurtransferase/TusA-related sulfurtransferase
MYQTSKRGGCKVTTVQVDRTLDAEGLSCPLPVVRTKKNMDEMNPGEVLEVRATDKGSIADLQGWAKRTGHQYIGLIEENGVLRHFLRKASDSEMKEEAKFPHTIQNGEVQKRLESGEKPNILDVREPAEYAFGRIPGATSIPLGELEEKMENLNPDDEYLVVCRTGNRSDLASQMLTEKGFKRVKNVLPGMIGWTGPMEKDE